MNHKRILICRTDSIGDVVLTLPMAGYLKHKWPEADIYFLGRTYTEPVVTLSNSVSRFINWDDTHEMDTQQKVDFLASLNIDAVLHVFPTKEITRLCAAAKIPLRVGTSGRLYNWLYCNKRVNFTRKRSSLHESQLNFKLLKALGLNFIPSFERMPEFYDLEVSEAHPRWKKLIKPDKYNLILHPKSKGSAVEWPEGNYVELIKQLPQDQFEIFICGTEPEGKLVPQLSNLKQENVTALFGAMSLNEYIRFIVECDGLLAASTGPLHIAAALGTKALGLFAPQKPIHPVRWKPIGTNTHVFVKEGSFGSRKKAIEAIGVGEVILLLNK